MCEIYSIGMTSGSVRMFCSLLYKEIALIFDIWWQGECIKVTMYYSIKFFAGNFAAVYHNRY